MDTMEVIMARKPTTQDKDWREHRRLQAWALYEKGWEQVKIAEALGVTKSAVCVWIKRAKRDGVDALLRNPPPGAVRKLPKETLEQLPEMLLRGAESFGFRGDLWTCPRIAKVIEQTWGVRYHCSHVSRLLKDLGWSSQKPKKKGNTTK
jgi:transposase